jgi:hypothetical protein
MDNALDFLSERFANAIKKHGKGIHVSFHETLGDVTEEYHEFIESVKNEDEVEKIKELSDVAISAIWGIASKYQRILDKN